MTKELLEKLGIDPALPPETIQAELEEKNLEYLERLDACTDEERLAQLRAEQQEVELALQDCREGKLPAPGKATKKKAEEASRYQSTPVGGDFAEGFRLFQAGDLDGALQILRKYADQGDDVSSILTAEIFKTQGNENDRRRYLFSAAQRGSGEAALMLALSYYDNDETEPAYKWANKAHELRTAGAGQLMMRILTAEKKWEEALKAAAEEMEWLSDYDRYSLCGDVRALLDSGCVSDEKIVKLIGPLEEVLKDSTVSWDLLKGAYQAAAGRERQRKEAREREKERREQDERRRQEEDAARREREAQAAKKEAKKKRAKLIVRAALILILAAVAAGGYYYFTEIRPSQKYETAEGLVKEGEYAQAEAIFRELGGYKDAESKLRASCAAHYAEAEALAASGRIAQAAVSYGTLVDYRDAEQKSHELWLQIYPYSVAVGRRNNTYAAVKADGSVLQTGNWGDSEDEFSDIVALVCGRDSLVGLRTDGTVVVTQEKRNEALAEWSDIIAVAGSAGHIVGLKANGTVVTSGENDDGQCETANWKNVIAVSANDRCTVGLLADGTVVSTDGNRYDWTGIRAVVCGSEFIVGLREDGTVVVSDGADEEMIQAVAAWGSVSRISAGEEHVVGFRGDCSVLAAGRNDDGRCDVAGWNVAGAQASQDVTIALQWDGTWVSAGPYNSLPDWTGIRVPGSPWEE